MRAEAPFAIAAICLALATPPGIAQERFRSRCGAGVHADERHGFIPLPQGSIFCPLVADPKTEHTFASYLAGDFATIADPASEGDTNIAAIGLGDSFGLFRIAGASSGDGLQLDIVGGLFAQFNLDEPSFDLINADYLVGLPLTFRARGFSSRLRLYHQSSHLGDEFLLSRQPERENLSFEALDLIISQEIRGLRVYAGVESFFLRRPDIAVVSRIAHGGAELRPGHFGVGRLVAAVDLKVVEQVDWRVGRSARVGFEIARVPSPGHPPRVLSVLAEYYYGPAPYGQFYPDEIRFLGVGIHFSL